VVFRPHAFEPVFHKHAAALCGGCQIHITDRTTFRPVETGVALVAAFRDAGPGQFAWREPPYEYEYDHAPIDILYGSPALREGLEAGRTAHDLVQPWADEVASFELLRRQYLLY